MISEEPFTFRSISEATLILSGLKKPNSRVTEVHDLAEPVMGADLPYSLSVSFLLIMPGHSAKMVSLNDVTRALTQHSINWKIKGGRPVRNTVCAV